MVLMRSLFVSSLALALASVQSVLSAPTLTSPVASTSGTGGQLLNVAWTDSNASPSLKSWDGINIFLATGDQNTQFKLQQLASNISTNSDSGRYTIDRSVGPSGQYYFIRMESTKVNSTNIPYMSFSARFTMNGMTGNFNSTVMAAATGAEGAGGSTTASTASQTSAAVSTSSLSTSRATSTSATAPASSRTSSPSSAGKTQQALNLVAGGAVAALGALVLL